jgi:hypothetical protein
MARNHTLRIHLEYEVLYVAELRALLNDFERAFNVLEAEESKRKRIPRYDRLTVTTIETGNSLTVILLGGVALGTLAGVIERIAKARETAWSSEEKKWKAKTAKLDYEERIKATEGRSRTETPPIVRAREIVETRIEKIEATEHIHSLEIEIDGKSTVILRPVRVEGNRRLAGEAPKFLLDGKRRILLPNEEKKQKEE